jgi:hypothetical protein
MSKVLIDNSGEIHTYAELKPFTNPQNPGWMHLRVTTVYDAARNPDEEQTRFDMCLSPETFQKFKDLFNGSST